MAQLNIDHVWWWVISNTLESAMCKGTDPKDILTIR